MALGEKIRQLRKEKDWSQAELAKKIDSDGRQISLYENDKTTPSPETIVKLAQIFDATTDYLLMEDTPRKAFVLEDKELRKYLQSIESLDTEDKKVLFYIIDSFLTKNKIKSFAQGIS